MTIYVTAALPTTADSSGLVTKNIPCDSTVYVGAFVYMDSGTAYNGIATSVQTSNIIGIVISKATATTCNILLAGITPGFFVGLDDTKNYFLSETVAGAMQDFPPPATVPNILINLGKAFDDTKFKVEIGKQLVRV